jgi:hypothetical protein
MNLIQILKLVSTFRDVSAVIKDETANGKPWWASRTVFGAIVVALSQIVIIYFNIDITGINLDQTADALYSIVGLVTTGYGSVLTLYGVYCKIKKALITKS